MVQQELQASTSETIKKPRFKDSWDYTTWIVPTGSPAAKYRQEVRPSWSIPFATVVVIC